MTDIKLQIQESSKKKKKKIFNCNYEQKNYLLLNKSVVLKLDVKMIIFYPSNLTIKKEKMIVSLHKRLSYQIAGYLLTNKQTIQFMVARKSYT